MNSPRMPRILWTVFFLLPTAGFVRAEPGVSGRVLDEQAMSARIDQHISAQWKTKSGRAVQPSAVADDAEFFRRLSLDLNGRIPSVRHIKDFLDDSRTNKRQIWADKLMDGRDPDFSTSDRKLADLYVNHFTHFWRNVLFAQTTNRQNANLAYQMDPWLQRVLRENLPYDRMVRELLAQQGRPFYEANENKPEAIAGSTARVFLGIKLECAQCHEDRSGGSWSQEQFWEYAAFFGGGRARQEATAIVAPTIPFPGKPRAIQARFLDGQKHAWKTNDDPRAVLATWLTDPANPWFARAAVNRMWYCFFGTGLTDPVDFMGTGGNPPSHPELLDELAGQFAAHHFDLKYIIRAITGSQAYQRTSARTHDSQDDPRLFARMPVRGMTPDQLFDSLQLATGRPDLLPGFLNQFRGNPRTDFIGKFANSPDKRTETQTSILQALYLMNNAFIADTRAQPGGALEIIANAGISRTRRIEELFLVTLSRKPRSEEMQRVLKHLDHGGRAVDDKPALADVYWALLNSPEFLLNH